VSAAELSSAVSGETPRQLIGQPASPGAAEILKNGDLVTVDGHLGIVTGGAAEFDLELGVTHT